MNCIDVLLSTDTVFESFSKLLFGFGLQSLFSIEDITISNYLFLSLVCSHQQCHILVEPLILQRSTTCVNRQVFVTVYDQEISWFKHNICIVGKVTTNFKIIHHSFTGTTCTAKVKEKNTEEQQCEGTLTMFMYLLVWLSWNLAR